MRFPYSGENKELDESARKSAGGSFIALTDGITHYELGGPENGKPLVLVHGFSVPYFIFDPTFDFLTKAGFRVLRYDLIGRGFSDRPQTAYDVHLFVRQLRDLLNALHLTRVSLLGLSMGGVIAATFVNQHPQVVDKFILIDPAGAKRVKLSPLLEALKMPLFGDLAFGLFGNAALVKGIASDVFDPKLVDHFQAQYKIQMQYKGFKQAILSTMRGKMLESFSETYASVGKMKKPTLLIWGKNDTTTPFENSAEILKAMPHAEFHAIENCGHIPHYEKPEIVNRVLLEFLEK